MYRQAEYVIRFLVVGPVSGLHVEYAGGGD